jgi:hypothetical protein
MVFGNDVADIASICTFNNLGMDMQDSITLRYTDGRMAVLNATTLSNSDRSGIIYGSKGYIVVDNVTNPDGISVYDNEYRKIAYYKRPRQKTGYEYEIEACVKALSQGWIECPQMPHSETLKMLNMMDFIRKNNHIVFPGEDEETNVDNSSFEYGSDAEEAQENTQRKFQLQTLTAFEDSIPAADEAESSVSLDDNGQIAEAEGEDCPNENGDVAPEIKSL